MVFDGPVDEGAQQMLRQGGVLKQRLDDVLACAFEHKGVRDHDRRGERRWPPLGGQVDDQGWQSVVEEHVAGEVAVDELAATIDRS